MENYPIKYKINNKVYYSVWINDDLASMDKFMVVNNKFLVFNSLNSLISECNHKKISLESIEIHNLFNLDFLFEISKLKQLKEALYLKKNSEYTSSISLFIDLHFLCDFNRTINSNFKIDGPLLEILDCFFAYKGINVLLDLTEDEFLYLKRFISESFFNITKMIEDNS